MNKWRIVKYPDFFGWSVEEEWKVEGVQGSFGWHTRAVVFTRWGARRLAKKLKRESSKPLKQESI